MNTAVIPSGRACITQTIMRDILYCLYRSMIRAVDEIPIYRAEHTRPYRLLKGEVQSRINIISKERVKISPQIGAKIMKIG